MALPLGEGGREAVAGAVMGSAELIGRVRRTLNHYGGSLDPHTGFLLARGIKTLALRVRAHNDNANAQTAARSTRVPRSPLRIEPWALTMIYCLLRSITRPELESDANRPGVSCGCDGSSGRDCTRPRSPNLLAA